MKREQIAALIGRKGGSGKTCTTMNLAGALMERGLRVLVVDLDPQASLTRLLTTTRVERGVGSCIANPDLPAADLIRSTKAGMDLLPGDRSIEVAGLELYDSPSGFHRLRRVLAPISGFDTVLLDTPPALGFALSSAVLAAGWAILPTALIQQDLDALVDTLAVLDELRTDGLQCAQALAIVPNEVRRDSADQDGLATLSAAYGALVADAVPHAVAIKHALNGRVPLSAYAPKAPAMAAYRSLAGRLLSAIEREPTRAQS